MILVVNNKRKSIVIFGCAMLYIGASAGCNNDQFDTPEGSEYTESCRVRDEVAIEKIKISLKESIKVISENVGKVDNDLSYELLFTHIGIRLERIEGCLELTSDDFKYPETYDSLINLYVALNGIRDFLKHSQAIGEPVSVQEIELLMTQIDEKNGGSPHLSK